MILSEAILIAIIGGSFGVTGGLGGIFATDWLNKRSEIRERKAKLFRKIMSFRGEFRRNSRTSKKFYRAMNEIEVVFAEHDGVMAEWDEYTNLVEQLGRMNDETPGTKTSEKDEVAKAVFSKFTALLQAMAKVVGHKSSVRNDGYFAQSAWAKDMIEQTFYQAGIKAFTKQIDMLDKATEMNVEATTFYKRVNNQQPK